MANAVVKTALAVLALAAPTATAFAADTGLLSDLTATGTAIAQATRGVPALFVSLAVIAAIPPLLLLGALVRFALSGSREQATAPAPQATEITPMPVGAAYLVGQTSRAPVRVSIGHTALRIGREPDCDVRIAHGTVHGYHALIERAGADGITITDLSAPDGNGVYVNGRRVRQARLVPGDMVALGAAVLRFTAEPLAGAAPLRH